MDPKNTMEVSDLINFESTNNIFWESPVSNFTVTNSNCRQTVVDSSNESYSSDTDEEGSPKVKRIKYELDPKTNNDPMKRYDIWSKSIQEEVLLEKLSNCDIGEVDRSRYIETYAVNNRLPTVNKSNQRFNQVHHKKNFRSSRRYNNKNKGKNLSTVQDVTVTSSDAEFYIAQEIASKLHEKNVEMIAKIVEAIGKVSALEIFRKTKAIEEVGGMLTFNNDRRRTPGGVFLQLVKLDGNLTPEQKKEIFIKHNNDDSERKRRSIKRKRKTKTRITQNNLN